MSPFANALLDGMQWPERWAMHRTYRGTVRHVPSGMYFDFGKFADRPETLSNREWRKVRRTGRRLISLLLAQEMQTHVSTNAVT